jgi:hypothetical protein
MDEFVEGKGSEEKKVRLSGYTRFYGTQGSETKIGEGEMGLLLDLIKCNCHFSECN